MIPSGLSREEVDFLRHLKLPFLLAWETSLPGSHIDFGQVDCARMVTERLLMSGHERLAFLGGFEASLDELKKTGIHEALESVGKCSKDLVEFPLPLDDGSAEEVFAELISQKPRFTAVIAADDGIAARFAQYLSTRTGMRVPETTSVASFHQYPFPCWIQKALSTVNFDFFEAGRRAADSLARASMTGETPTNVPLPGTIVDGATIGGRPILTVHKSASSAS